MRLISERACRPVAQRGVAVASVLFLIGAVLAALGLAVAPSAAASPSQSGGTDVAAWAPGWSWTYKQSFLYAGGGNNVTVNESVTSTVAGTTTYGGFSVYKVNLSGNVTGGGGSAQGYDLSVSGGSVSGTVYLRRSDLALVYETQTHHLSGKVHESFISVSFSANATINLTPSPAWRRADFRLHSGDSWTAHESVAYSGGFNYDASGLVSGSSPFNGTMSLNATPHVSNATASLPIGSVSTQKVAAADGSSGTEDDIWWSSSYHNIAEEHMVLPVSGNTITMDRSLSSASLPTPSPSLTTSLSPNLTCKGGPVTVSGRLSSHASGKAVTVTLDGHAASSTSSQVKHTSTTSGGYYSATVTAPTAADGLARAGSLGSWGVVVDGDGAVGAATLEVEPINCTTLVYAGATSAPHGTTIPVSATLTDLTGASVAGRTVTFALSGQAAVHATTNSAGVASTTLAVQAPARSATLTVSFAGNAAQEPASTSKAFDVKADTTQTTISSSEPSAVIGDPVTFTAHVVATDGEPIPAAAGSGGSVQFTVDGSNLGSPVPITNGTATSPAASTMALGTHTVNAQYLGTNDYSPSSDQLTQHVSKALTPTTTTVGIAPASSVYGQQVTVTATVAPSTGTGVPTGQVIFTDSTTSQVLGSDTLTLGSGGDQASTTVADLAPGSHAIVATYQGDTTFKSSASTPEAATVNKAATTTNVVSDLTPSVTGQPVSYTVTVAPVAPGAGAPTGTVQLNIGGTDVGSPVALSGGTASIPAVPTGNGNVAVTAQYSGDANFQGSTGATTQTVNKADTTTVVDVSPTASIQGQAVTLTATVAPVAPGAGAPSGLVTFTDTTTSTTVGSAPLSSTPQGQKATFTVSNLAVGTHAISASYAGDTGFNPSASTTADETVTAVPPKLATTVQLSSSAASATYGQAVTVTATVVPQAQLFGTPTGTVTFTVDGSAGAPVTLDPTGAATATIPGLAAGDHSIQASYSGAAKFQSSGNTLTQHVDQAPTATALTSSASSPNYGDPVTFTATVTTPAPGAGTPDGVVQFTVDGAALGTPATLTNGAATSVAATDLGPGPHVVAAVYSGAANFAGSNASSLNQAVQAIPSTTALVSSQNPSAAGEMVTLTATVTPSTGNWSPTGSVTFLDGTTTLATAPLTIGTTPGASYSTAQVSLSTLTVGSHPITAVYGGDVDVAGSTSNVVTQVVNAVGTTTVLASSPNPSVFGNTVTFTATVAPAAGNSVPSGNVVFTDTSTSTPAVLGTATLAAGTNGDVASITVPDGSVPELSVGSHTVVATYGGDLSDQGSTSSSVTQVVNKAATMTSLSSAPNPSLAGQQVTFTATIVQASGSAAPSGSVTFTEGSAVLGTAPVSSGTAALELSTLSTGSHHVTATYSGDASYLGSASSPATQTVEKIATSTALGSTPNPSTYGQQVTFTATVTPGSGSGTPTGTVSFSDGTTVLGTAPLNAGSATLATSALVGGTHHVTATYSGDSTYAPSTSPVHDQVVNRIATRLVANAAVLELHLFGPSTLLKLKAELTTANGTPLPGRTLVFHAGSTLLCSAVTDSGGVANCGPGGAGEALLIANGGFTVTFAGDDGYQPSSGSAGLVHVIGLG